MQCGMDRDFERYEREYLKRLRKEKPELETPAERRRRELVESAKRGSGKFR